MANVNLDVLEHLETADPSEIEVLSADELDVVSGGGPYSGNSNCVSICDIDGNDEPGTS